MTRQSSYEFASYLSHESLRLTHYSSRHTPHWIAASLRFSQGRMRQDCRRFISRKDGKSGVVGTVSFAKTGTKAVTLFEKSIAIDIAFVVNQYKSAYDAPLITGNKIGHLMKNLKKVNKLLKRFTFSKIPLAFFASPKITQFDKEAIVVRIPLCFRTRNHLKCMYFGALTIGADLSSGFLAYELIRCSGKPVHLIFKSMNVQFLKRAESAVYFTCRDGQNIHALVDKALTSKEREEILLTVVATTPDTLGDEPIATFELMLSIKLKT